jgi:hypothetical protein
VVVWRRKKTAAKGADVSSTTPSHQMLLRPWLAATTRCSNRKLPRGTLRYVSTTSEGHEPLETVEDWTAFQLRRAERKQICESVAQARLPSADMLPPTQSIISTILGPRNLGIALFSLIIACINHSRHIKQLSRPSWRPVHISDTRNLS